MQRWHQEKQHMFRLWKEEMGHHGYDWRCPPTDPGVCHCVTGIGHYRKKRPLGHHRHCLLCNWEKYLDSKARLTKRQQAIRFELEASGS